MPRPDETNYVPALAYRWLTPLYDPLVRATTRERAFKGALIESARVGEGTRLLDLGCGTGTLAIWAKQRHPGAHVHGLDGDPEILARARSKATAAGVEVELREGLSFDLPYPDDSFDRVTSSLFFHHLVRSDKVRTMAEVRRVLRPDGELHIADWGEPRDPVMAVLSKGVVLLDGREQTADNMAGRLLGLVRDAGFPAVSEGDSFRTPFGVVRLLAARA